MHTWLRCGTSWRREIWKQAQNELNSFQMKQVNGCEEPKQVSATKAVQDGGG